jgi:predicted CXXCH cytochrome family protein
VTAFVAALCLAGFAPAPPLAAQELSEAVEYCLLCHADGGLTLELEDGDEMSLDVEPEALAASVHGRELVCTDCHEDYDDDDAHPSGASFESRRAYVLRSYEVCRTCHFETYTRTLESIHFTLLAAGREEAPVCTDCHGAHSIADPHRKEAMMSRSCGSCHDAVLDQYVQSVHGSAVREGVEGVPSCTDCHTAHSIADARTAGFHITSPQICIACHGDAEKMAPYGLSTDVVTSYLADFHGVTATLADPDEVEERHLVVTCVDCHGVHEIASPALIGGERMKARVEAVCADCHQEASKDFPAAWLSHYRPSLRHAPLVYLVDLFYKIFIPFVVLGLTLQIGLHLYRIAVRR